MSEEENEDFQVEKILKKRVKNGKTEYFLKWVGYSEEGEFVVHGRLVFHWLPGSSLIPF